MKSRIASLGQLLWANPIVIRDLRVFLRGAKAYWALAGYLFTLGTIVLVGYGSSLSSNVIHGGMMNVVDLQRSLQSFYYFVFMTIATLLSLIAPALTAASITAERQRQTLDLLVTTPLSSAQMLTGKILSSVAFLLLLLALSLPASALCIILGGATLGDVLRIYLLLAIDSLVLSAIGIAFSCNVRVSLAAIGWTYFAVIAFEIISAMVFASLASGPRSATMMAGGAAMTDLNPGIAIAALNPYLAVFVGSGTIGLFGLQLPVWLVTALVAVLVIRLLLTGAACRLKLYGGNAYASLRRQLLFITALVMVPLADGVATSLGYTAGAAMDRLLLAIYLLTFAFLIPGALFLPSLFVPAHGEELPPRAETGGWYRPRRAFKPEHAAALPFFHLWLLTLLASALIGFAFAGQLDIALTGYVFLVGFYLSGLGFLYWSICRLAGAMVRQYGPAQALAFGLLVLISAVPPMVNGLIGIDITESAIAPVWIFYPLVLASKNGSGDPLGPIVWGTAGTGLLCYGLGAVVGILVRSIERARSRNETRVAA